MSSWAKPGVKCVCVDVRGEPGKHLAKGGIYTISAKMANRGNTGLFRNVLSFVLVEVRNPLSPNGGFAAIRFRPLVTRTQSQDLALFTPLLETQGVDA